MSDHAVGYADLATTWYNKYRVLQVRIDKIEANAMTRYGNRGLATFMLGTGSEYWRYRELVADRDMALRHAHVNSSMAAMEAVL